MPPSGIGHAYYKYYVFVRPDALRPEWDRDRIMAAVNAEDKTATHEIKHGRHLYANEALTVAEYLEQRQAPRPAMSWEDSLGQMRTLDALRADIGLVFDCEKA